MRLLRPAIPGLLLAVLLLAALLAPATLLAQSPDGAQIALSQARIQSDSAPISKFPRVNVLHRDFGSSCPNAADPTGIQDSTCALQAAIDYADARTIGGQLASVYLPAGNYRLTKSLRLPYSLQVLTDGPTASALTLAPGVRTNAITVYPPAHGSPDPFLCSGGIDGLMIAGSGHENTGTLLEVIDAPGYRLSNIKLYNSGGRGLALLGSSERIESNNLEIDAVRWPIVMTVNTNEDHFYKTNIEDPGIAADGYCFNVNCVDGRFPEPNASHPTPIRPDPHGAVWMSGADVAFYGGSIKTLEYQPAFHVAISEANTIANFYFEDFPHADRPVLNAGVIVGGVYPSTKLSAPLAADCASGCSAAVEDTSWFPDYASEPGDVKRFLGDTCYEQEWIMPSDFVWGDSSPSSAVPGVARGQYEKACVAGMAGDGRMYFAQRHIATGPLASTAPAGVTWPAGSIVHMIDNTLNYGSGLTLLTNHFSGIVPGGKGYAAQCDDSGVNTCGSIIAGVIPDGYFFSGAKKTNSATAPGQALLTLIGNTFFTGGPEPLGMGFIKAHSSAVLNILSAPEGAAFRLQTSSVLHGVEGETGLLPLVHAATYPNGDTAQVVLSRPDAAGWINTYHGFYEQAVSTIDGELGTNPGSDSAKGHQFASSSCWFDTGTPQSPHAAHRFCLTGSPGATAGWQFDRWDGKAWVSTFSVTDENGQGHVRLNGSPLQGASNGKAIGNATACSFDRDGLTSPLAKQPVCTVPRTGTYEITLNARASTVGASGRLDAVRVSVVTAPGAGMQSCATSAAVSLTAGSTQQFAGPCTLHIEAGQPVTVSAETSAIAGGAAYGVSVLVRQVQ
ncbi:glycosyl hydrolase family 28-related protein [Silvibacterium sp.]|uniref:glycosyl hydrolase family 28-related protein n=1 Tax=Silvibacterium sp. TaxID=1964179 RepID=UPI0039E418F2